MSNEWQETLVAPMDDAAAEDCAHYFAMLHDLDIARMALVRLAQQQGSEKADVAGENIYFDYALMHYFRCFGRGDSHLNMKIFQDLEKAERREAKRIHSFLQETHEYQCKRPHKIFDQVKIGVALEEGKKKGVRDVFWLMNRFQARKPALIKGFTALISIVQEKVSELAKEKSGELLESANKIGNKELYKTAIKGSELSKSDKEDGDNA